MADFNSVAHRSYPNNSTENISYTCSHIRLGLVIPQVVRANTQEVGCGIRYCPSLPLSSTVTGGIIVVCNYGAA